MPVEKPSASKVIINLLIILDPCLEIILTPVVVADMYHTIQPNHGTDYQVIPPVIQTNVPAGTDCGLLNYAIVG